MVSHVPTDARTGVDHSSGHPAGRAAIPTPRPSAVQLLEMTARDTDQWRSEARGEAEAIVAAARHQAAALVSSAQAQAEELVTAARHEAERITQAAHREAAEVRDQLDTDRQRGEAQVAHLRELATDHADRLRDHLTEMLTRIDSVPASVRATAGG
jgi:cell division septum initiation protein DivIVA